VLRAGRREEAGLSEKAVSLYDTATLKYSETYYEKKLLQYLSPLEARCMILHRRLTGIPHPELTACLTVPEKMTYLPGSTCPNGRPMERRLEACLPHILRTVMCLPTGDTCVICDLRVMLPA
jgi:hypothetical protein